MNSLGKTKINQAARSLNNFPMTMSVTHLALLVLSCKAPIDFYRMYTEVRLVIVYTVIISQLSGTASVNAV